jgi:nucleoside 2-deoxyribosyltransferase
VLENGELAVGADQGALQQTYRADYDLLKACSLVFAVPTGRDPGTLVELGIAIEASIPTVVYDPADECNNTMVIGGASFYSRELDLCLNATFSLLGEKRAAQ